VTELTAKERTERGAVCMRHGMTPDHPELLAVAEQLTFRRRFDERLSRFEAIAQRVEAATDRAAIDREFRLDSERAENCGRQPLA